MANPRWTAAFVEIWILKFSEFSAGQLHIVCELHVNYTILYMKMPSFEILAPYKRHQTA